MAMNPYVGWGLTSLAMYFLNKKSNSSNDSDVKPEDLNINNQTQIGSPIPVVLGRRLIKSPIVSYFGDFRADKYTETYAAHAKFNAWPLVFSLIAAYIAKPATATTTTVGTGYHGTPVHSKGTSKDFATGPLLNALFMFLLNWLINGRNLKTTMQKGFKYYLGYQFLVCWSSENMRIKAIYLKEKKVWEGNESKDDYLTAPFVVKVNDDELFGGPDEGGGFIGEMHCYLGGENQGADAWMIKQMSSDSVQAELRGLTPAYRSFVSIVVPTAYIGKSATIPETWIELQDCPNKLGLGPIGEDANPAEILYELHVNNDWGLAESPELINKNSLVKVGEVLKKEGVGISIEIPNINQAQNLIDKICEHINAVKFSDPKTGKLTYRLIRDDYNVDELMRIDVTNCSNVEFTRLDWGETVSKISVAYTDRKALYEQSTIPAVDPANIEINNGTQTTKTYDYTYFTTAENALWAAKRELNQQAYPLATASITGNRKLSNLRIGDVVVLNWEPYGIKNMLLRVTDVDLGDFIDGTVKIETIEDVFGLAKTDFGFSGSTEWEKEETYPSGVQNFRYLEMPYEICQCDDTYVSAFAVKPDNKTQTWTVWRQKPGSNFESTNSMSNWSAAGRLVYDIDEFGEVEDLIGFEIVDLGGIDKLESSNIADIAVARKGSRLLVVDDEIIAYSTLMQMPNGHWYVKGILRGTFDTVPRKHAAETNVFFISNGFYANVTTGGPVCLRGNVTEEQYNITTSTVDHNEEFEPTKIKGLTTTRRPELPSVPGKIRISAHLKVNLIQTSSIAGDLNLAFVNRNKRFSFGCVSQDDEKEYWTKQEFEAEDDADYLVKITVGKESKDYIIKESPFVYPWEQRCLDFIQSFTDETRIQIYSRKNDLLSYQPQERHFNWIVPTVVDGVEKEDAGANTLNDWGIDDRIVIPEGAIATTKQIMFADMPIIILGTSVSPGTANSIRCYDGSYLVPNGQIMIIMGRNTYEIYNMKNGFSFASYYVPTASGGKVYYRWDGNKINEFTMR